MEKIFDFGSGLLAGVLVTCYFQLIVSVLFYLFPQLLVPHFNKCIVSMVPSHIMELS